jgi:hypothetical protein
MHGSISSPENGATQYKAAFEIATELAAMNVDSSGAQRDLAVAHEKIDFLNSCAAILVKRLRAMNPVSTFAKADPNNADWKRDLAVANAQVGHDKTNGLGRA